jgi:hypothetical protein
MSSRPSREGGLENDKKTQEVEVYDYRYCMEFHLSIRILYGGPWELHLNNDLF